MRSQLPINCHAQRVPLPITRSLPELEQTGLAVALAGSSVGGQFPSQASLRIAEVLDVYEYKADTGTLTILTKNALFVNNANKGLLTSIYIF